MRNAIKVHPPGTVVQIEGPDGNTIPAFVQSVEIRSFTEILYNISWWNAANYCTARVSEFEVKEPAEGLLEVGFKEAK